MYSFTPQEMTPFVVRTTVEIINQCGYALPTRSLFYPEDSQLTLQSISSFFTKPHGVKSQKTLMLYAATVYALLEGMRQQ